VASGHPHVVTLAAFYGAGGTVIGPKVAERLGVRYLDRQIPEEVAKLANLPEEAVADLDEEPRSRTDRVVSALGRASTITGTTAVGSESLDVQERRIRSYFEEALARASTEGGVILGRGGMVVLRELPSAVHVFLGGPREERIAQAMEIDRIDHETAAERLGVEDKARIGYVQRAYGVDGLDPRLYHLILDSTAIDLSACVELIVAASEARVRDPRPSPAA
jgi:cytidylate kinase